MDKNEQQNPKDAPQFRACLTIQNHNKRKYGQDVILKNKHPISQNIQLCDRLFIAGWAGWDCDDEDLMLGCMVRIKNN